jgi:peroxiredoxin
MELTAPGDAAPPIPGADLGGRPRAVFFYKVTCPVCQLSAPKAQTLEEAYPGSVLAVGEDPAAKLQEFASAYGMDVETVPDEEPFPASDAYGVRAVPTLFLIDENGSVDDVVESWDRDGYNRVSARLAEMTGSSYVEISAEGDGLPAFRPG